MNGSLASWRDLRLLRRWPLLLVGHWRLQNMQTPPRPKKPSNQSTTGLLSAAVQPALTMSTVLSTWAKRTPIGYALPGSWLQIETLAGRDPCIVCSAAFKCRRDMYGSAHVAQKLLTEFGAASKGDFRKLWRCLRTPSAISKQMVQSDTRTASMECCLYEAIRNKQRAKANTMAVAMDERKGHLLVTFCARAGLKVCNGVFANLQHTGKRALLKLSTKRLGNSAAFANSIQGWTKWSAKQKCLQEEHKTTC